MYSRFLATAIVIGALGISARPALADEVSARAALNAALDRADKDARTAPRLSFTETVAEKGVVVTGRFTPGAPSGGQWTPVGAVAASGQERDSYRGIVRDTPNERDLFLNRIRPSLGNSGRLVSEAGGEATFDFAMSPQAHPTHSPLDGALNLAAHVRVELTVNEATQLLTRMRFYAPAPFSATPLARVDHVNLGFSFGDSYFGGPLVVRRIDTDAGYHVAGFPALMRDTVWFNNVQPAPPDANAMSAAPGGAQNQR